MNILRKTTSIMDKRVITTHHRKDSSKLLQDKASDEKESEINQLLTNIPEVAEKFTVIEKIGEGTFSKVYHARCKRSGLNNEEYALKYLIPTSHPTRIANEMRCLRDIGGSCNVMGVKTNLMHKGHVLIVMPYFPHDKFTDYFRKLTVQEVQDYMYNLFIALNRVHSHGIIHRDVKPSNFLCNRKLKKYSLVDFGLAQRVDDLRNSAAEERRQRHLLVDRKNKMNFEQNSTSELLPNSAVPEKEVEERNYANNSATSNKRLRGNGQENEAQSPAVKRRKASPAKQSVAAPSYLVSPLTKAKNLQQLSLTLKSQLHQFASPAEVSSSRGSNCMKPPSSAVTQKQRGQSPRRNNSAGSSSAYGAKQQNKCLCYGRNEVCNICLSRVAEAAPRGGTAGFRAPEVLLKLQEQTTAVDMWSAGVIFLSLLSGRYPFFRAVDDLSSLAEIMTVLGTARVQRAAESIGKTITLSTKKPSLDLKMLCQKLRGVKDVPPMQSVPSTSAETSWTNVPNSAYDLLGWLLDPDPSTRITAQEALAHPFITEKLS